MASNWGLPVFNKKNLATVQVILLWIAIPAIVIALSAEFLSGRRAGEIARWIWAMPTPFGVAFMFLAALLLGLLGLTARPVIGLIIAGGSVLLLAAVSGEKLRYLTEPLFPWDLMSVRQIADLLPVLIKDASIKRALFGLVIVCALFVGLFATRRFVFSRAPISWPFRTAAVLCAAVPLSVPLYNLTDEWNTNILREFSIVNYNWNQKLNHSRNGFLVSFIVNTQNAIIRAPADYSQGTVSAAVSGVMAPGTRATVAGGSGSTTTPNVVIVMSEAFWDPTLLPTVEFSRDPLRFFHSLHTKQSQNYLMSPSFAGATANVEFEALTGFSNAFMPYGSIPYQQYISRKTPSLASFFASQGYETTAVHTYHGWFWRRNDVYRHFGFDKFVDSKEFANAPKKGLYIADDALTDRIVSELAEAKKPKFIFAVSMQNHSPYAPGRYENQEIRATSPRLPSDMAQSLEVYSQGIADADRGFENLVKAIEASGKPTLVLFFGDHLPFLGPDLDVYRKTGFFTPEVGPITQDSLLKSRHNPFVMWNNFGAPTQFGTASPAFFPLFITKALGITHPFYTDFLSSVMAEWPVLDISFARNNVGEVKSLAEAKTTPRAKAYQLVQHDILFGEQYSFPTLFNGGPNVHAAGTMLQ